MARRNTRAGTLGTLPRTDGVIARLACARARRAGIALPPLLKKANLTLQQINDPRNRLPARDQIRLLNLVAEALEDDLLGFHLAQDCDLREIGLLYYVLASSETLIEAVRRGVRYSSLVNESLFQQCTIGRHIGIALHYVGVSRHLDRHQAECFMVLIVRMLRQLTGVRIRPHRVRFTHSRKKTPGEFVSSFGSDIEFGAAADEISFARTIGSAPVVSADPFLHNLLVRHYEEALAHRRPARGSLRTGVENAIVSLLPHAEVRASEIARRLGLSQRTFARRLSAEGLTFSALLDRLRLDLANRYLADGDASISQIAWLLGYREVSAFSKAFRRWTGKSPRDARTGKIRRPAAGQAREMKTS